MDQNKPLGASTGSFKMFARYSSLLESPNLPVTTEVKVRKNRNDFMKILFLPICNEIIVRISLEIGRNDVFIKSFWFLLTFSKYFFFLFCFFLEVSFYIHIIKWSSLTAKIWYQYRLSEVLDENGLHYNYGTQNSIFQTNVR